MLENKFNKKFYVVLIVISAALCLLPMIYGIKVYNMLPDNIPTHFDFNGQINGYTNKYVFVYIFPIIMFFVTLIASTIMFFDPFDKNNINKNPVMVKICILLIPLISNICSYFSYKTAITNKLPNQQILFIFMGVLFILLGNYMPKNKQNAVIGIRTPWTLKDEKNWYKTNKLAGYIFFIFGIWAIFLNKFVNQTFSFVAFGISMFLIYGYSFYLYKKDVQ